MNRQFFKLTGAGNDFIGLVEPDREPSPSAIRTWCRRRLSVGADGLFVLSRLDPKDSASRVRMRHFNPDGQGADLCVNGVRCAARLTFELGWASEDVVIVTDAGDIQARPEGRDAIRLTLDAGPYPSRALDLDFAIDGRPAPPCWMLTVGVPHLVVPCPGPAADVPVAALGPRLRSHRALGSAGANVNFAVGLETAGLETAGLEGLEIRTFERGVEGETLACGSGVLAVASVALEHYDARFPLKITTRAGHEFEISEHAGRWQLCAHAQLIARGELIESPQAPDTAPARVGHLRREPRP